MVRIRKKFKFSIELDIDYIPKTVLESESYNGVEDAIINAINQCRNTISGSIQSNIDNNLAEIAEIHAILINQSKFEHKWEIVVMVDGRKEKRCSVCMYSYKFGYDLPCLGNKTK